MATKNTIYFSLVALSFFMIAASSCGNQVNTNIANFPQEQCSSYATCDNNNKTCSGGLSCIRLCDGQSEMEGICISVTEACQKSCGKPECRVAESAPAQIFCN